MKKCSFFLIVFILHLSCNSAIFMYGSNPPKKSFKYYNSSFQVDSNSNLKLNRKYYFNYPNNQGTCILVFFNDGFLNNHFTTSIDGVSGQRSESGGIMGYYITKKDSIFFTTRSYYNPRAVVYEGKIINDTMNLKVKYPKSKNFKLEQYVLYK